MTNEMKFDQYQRESKRTPLKLTLPDGETITIPIPGGEKMMEIEEAGVTRKALRAAFGEHWPKVEPLVKSLPDADAVREFTVDVMRKLGVAADDAPPADGPR